MSDTSAHQKYPPRWIKLLQDGFVIWVLLGAWWGYSFPEIAASGKTWIPEMLAAVMLGMGLTLRPVDLMALKTAGRPVVIGVCLQFLVMPLAAWLLALTFSLPHELAVGLILVGAAPGGTASNVVAWLARGDVALSVTMTTASTLLAPLLTPLWIWLLASTWLHIEPLPLFLTVIKIVLAPVLIGVAVRAVWTPGERVLQGMLPLFSMLMIAWIVGIITGLDHAQLAAAGASVLAVVVLLNAAGLCLGYMGAKHAGQDVKRRRTVAIEVGMQNSGLAVAMAVSHFGALAALPGAMFSIWHNVSGPLLASIWQWRQGQRMRDVH